MGWHYIKTANKKHKPGSKLHPGCYWDWRNAKGCTDGKCSNWHVGGSITSPGHNAAKLKEHRTAVTADMCTHYDAGNPMPPQTLKQPSAKSQRQTSKRPIGPPSRTAPGSRQKAAAGGKRPSRGPKKTGKRS
jgi:hypothetical protein